MMSSISEASSTTAPAEPTGTPSKTIPLLSARIKILHAEEPEEISACFPVMKQLRAHLVDAEAFRQVVQRQRTQGYRLLAAWDASEVVGLAGYRCMENLIHGQFLYVDDLVTVESARGRGIGDCLLRELRRVGKVAGCERLVLDTALANSLAQRFYFRAGMLSRGLHFAMNLK